MLPSHLFLVTVGGRTILVAAIIVAIANGIQVGFWPSVCSGLLKLMLSGYGLKQ